MDVLSTLQECSYRGISFPIANIDETGSHDMPQHKRADRDGAFVEGTGRNPFEYSVTAIFVNGVAKGKNETWNDLFPNRFLKLRSAWGRRTTGELIHPIYGKIKVKPLTWHVSLSPDIRDGVMVELVFVETNDDSDSPAVLPSNLGFAKATAANLDTLLGTLNPDPRKDLFENEPESNFLDMVDTAIAAVDTASRNAQASISKIDRTIGKLQKLENSLSRTAEVFSTNTLTNTTQSLGDLGAGAATILRDSSNLTFSLLQIRSSYLQNVNKGIGTYTVQAPMMIMGLGLILRNTIAELLELNPGLQRGRRPILVPNTVVKFYTKD